MSDQPCATNCGSTGRRDCRADCNLTNAGNSCSNYCSSRGGYDEATESIVGTANQGGSRSKCEDIFNALGYSGGVNEGTHNSGLGVGCNLWTDNGSRWWCRHPSRDPDVGLDRLRMVCACNR
jgi:hypothetical protein